MQKRSLGRGLSDLLGGSGTETVGSRAVLDLEVRRLTPNPFQPRRAFDEDELRELADSVREQGILQPIIVRQTEDGYQIIAGERRWRAAQLVGLTTVPCLVQELDDHQALAVALIENLQRENLNPLEAARAYRQLMQNFELTQEQVAREVGKSRSAVANSLRLLGLPQTVQEALADGRLSEGHGRALLSLRDEDEMVEMATRVVAEDLSVRQIEEMVRKKEEKDSSPARAASSSPPLDPHYEAAADRLQEALATKVAVKANKRGRGRVIISFHNEEELSRLLDHIAPEYDI